MRPRSRALLVCLVLPLGVARVASAQGTCNTARGDVFTAYSVSTPTVLLPTPAVTEFNAGASGSFTVSVTIQPTNANKNRAWYLCALPAAATWTTTATGATKSSATLQVRSRIQPQGGSFGAWSAWQSFPTSTVVPLQVATSSGTATVELEFDTVLSYATDQPRALGPAGSYANASYSLAFDLQLAH